MHRLVVIYIALTSISSHQISRSESLPTSKSDIPVIVNRHGIDFAGIPIKLSARAPKENISINSDKNGNQSTTNEIKYYMSVFEITQNDWERIMGEKFIDFLNSKKILTGFDAPVYLGKNKPIYNLDIKDAEKFVAALNLKEINSDIEHPWRYAIPSAAEWEYAARAGVKDDYLTGKFLMPSAAVFEFHSTIIDPDELPDEWHREIMKIDAISGPSEVGKRSIANSFGLFDVHGNVSEITSDISKDAEISFPELRGVDIRINKGGAWDHTMIGCAFSASGSSGFKYCRGHTGLRVIAFQK